jgi:predicted phosphodiesterase
MTRIALLADIHGNLPALEAVRADMAAYRLDRVVVAGDVINWGPFSPEVLAIVQAEGWAAIRGNNELYLLEHGTPRQPPHWERYTLLPWLYEQLGERGRSAIAAWPDELTLRFPDAPLTRVVHGRPGDHWRGMYPQQGDAELAAILAGVGEPAVIAAHTHIPMNLRAAGRQIINPGSVGVPLDGDLSASYVILEAAGDQWRPIFRRVEYDLSPLWEAFARQRFAARGGPVAELVVREFETARLWVLPYLAWRDRHAPGQPDTAELLAAFLAEDPWRYTPREYWPEDMLRRITPAAAPPPASGS